MLQFRGGAQAEADDPTRVKWEWALTKAGKSVTYDPSLDWKELTSPAAEALEEHHTEGFFHSGEETCYLNGEEFSGGARTAVYENSMDYSKANMMTGLYASLTLDEWRAVGPGQGLETGPAGEA